MTFSTNLLREHTVPTPIHALTFSPGGERLAFAAGREDGNGSIGCLDDEGKVVWTHDAERISYHGLSFDRTGRHIVAAGWAPGHQWHPVHLFDIDSPAPPDSAEGEDLTPLTVARPVRASHAPSALLHDGALITYCTCRPQGRTINFLPLPQGLVESRAPQHLTSARLIAAHGALMTCAPDTPGDTPDRAPVPSRAILMARRQEGSALSLEQVAHPHQGRVAALLMDPAGETLVTGGEDGTISVWTLSPAAGALPGMNVLALHHVHFAAIEGMCFLPAAGLAITVDRDGYMVLWRDHRVQLVVRLPGISPRALAAHPEKNRVVVGGLSHPASEGPSGRLLVYEVTQ